MASVHVAFTTANATSENTLLPVPSAYSFGEVYLDSEAVSEITAPARPNDGYVAVVTCDSGPAWVRFGKRVDSALQKASNWWLVLEGQTREFSVNAGDAVELADAHP